MVLVAVVGCVLLSVYYRVSANRSDLPFVVIAIADQAEQSAFFSIAVLATIAALVPIFLRPAPDLRTLRREVPTHPISRLLQVALSPDLAEYVTGDLEET